MSLLFEHGAYAVKLGTHTEDNGRTTTGYCVENKDTGVTEYTTTMLFHAIKWCKICNDEVEKELLPPIVKEPASPISWQDAVEQSVTDGEGK